MDQQIKPVAEMTPDELNLAIAELREQKPIYVHEPHIDIRWSEHGNWYCLPEYDQGDMCEWKPANFAGDIGRAWELDGNDRTWHFIEHRKELKVFLDERGISIAVVIEPWRATKAETYATARCRAWLLAKRQENEPST